VRVVRRRTRQSMQIIAESNDKCRLNSEYITLHRPFYTVQQRAPRPTACHQAIACHPPTEFNTMRTKVYLRAILKILSIREFSFEHRFDVFTIKNPNFFLNTTRKRTLEIRTVSLNHRKCLFLRVF
jgi:hypothetical protein